MAPPIAKSCVAPTNTDLTVRDISPVKNYVGSKSEPVAVTTPISQRRLPTSRSLSPPFRMLGCEAHRCQLECHSGPCQPCPRSPSLVKTCPCSQTPLTKLLELGYSERQSCSDAIPSCGKTCNRPLACGSSGEGDGNVDSESFV